MYKTALTKDINFKYYTLLCMLYFSVLVASDVVVYKLFALRGFEISVGTLIFPLTYIFGDVIAEVYGYQLSRQLIWISLFCELFFCVLLKFGVSLPAPSGWHGQGSYEIVLSKIFNVSFAHILAEPVGAFINAYVLTKCKIYMGGRLFWIRSLGATAIGELLFSIIAPVVVFFSILPTSQIAHIIVSTYIVKFVFSTISVIPASLIVKILKRQEGVDIYDYNTDFSPFKINVNWKDS